MARKKANGEEKDQRARQILERIARNMPVRSLKFEYLQGEHGKICIAFGKDSVGNYRGIWGCCGVGRILEFKADTTQAQVREVLLTDAAGFIALMEPRGMLEAGFWDA